MIAPHRVESRSRKSGRINCSGNGKAGREREQSQTDSLEEPGARPRRRFTSEPLWYAAPTRRH
jgi:hypothetical protein